MLFLKTLARGCRLASRRFRADNAAAIRQATRYAVESLETRLLLSTTYYVSPTGNDANTGLSAASPWKSVYKINQLNLLGGDQVLFQGGSTFANGNVSIPVTNPGFETGDNTGWAGYFNYAAIDPTAAHTGNYGVTISTPVGSVFGSAENFLDANAYKPNTGYTFSAWGKATAGATGFGYVGIHFYNAGVVVGGADIYVGSTTYQFYKKSFISPAAFDFVELYAYKGEGDMNLSADDFAIVENPNAIALNPSDTGSTATPIVIGSYGGGSASFQDGDGVGLFAQDTAGIQVSNLNFAGTWLASNASGGSVSIGVEFLNDLPNSVKLNYLRVDNVNVSGFKLGGIRISGRQLKSGFNDVRITNSVAHDNGDFGIRTGGIFDLASTNYAHTNVYIGYCQSYNNTGLAETGIASGSGILLSDVNGAVVEHCTTFNNGQFNKNLTGGGPFGVWSFDSKALTIQYNESYGNKTNSAFDGGGFDLDGGVSNSVVQYNYSHGNMGAGFLAYRYAGTRTWGNNVYRYNISENDGRGRGYGGIYMGDSISNAQFYNNTIYLTPFSGVNLAAIRVVSVGINTSIRNNIIVTTGAVKPLWSTTTNTNLTLQGNDYWSSGAAFNLLWGTTNYTTLADWQLASGQESLSGFSTGFNIDPQLTAPGTGVTIGFGNNLNTLTGYQLKTTSLLINSGLDLPALFGTSVGTQDFYGTTLPQQAAYEVGANEVKPTTSTPLAKPGGPYQANEGTSFPVSGARSTGPIDLYEWDFNYNGSTFNVSATGVAPKIPAAQLDGPSTRTIALRVTGGGTSNIATTTLNVANVAPVVNAGPDVPLTSGGTFTASGSFTDPGPNDTWTATVNYGDGAGPIPLTLSGKTFSLSKVYNTPATYTVTVAVTDNNAAVGSDSAIVTVTPPSTDPVAIPGGPYQTNEGTSVILSGSGSTGTIDTYEWDFNYNGTTFNVSATGVSPTIPGASLDGPSSRTIALRVTGGGKSNIATTTLTIANVAPTIAINGATTANEGATYTLTLGAVTDPGADTVSSYVVHWGDGSTSTYNSNGDKTHIFADGAASRAITVDLTDEDNTYLNVASSALTVNVANVAPTIAISGATAASEGAIYTLTLGAVTDPGTDTVSSYVVHWGDGSTSTYATIGDKTHVFTDGPATRAISVDLTDEDGTFLNVASSAISITVANVAPTIAISGATSVNEGATYNLTLGAVTDPGTDTVTSYVVHWGDNTSSTYSTSGVKTHTYADGPTSNAITVDLTDEDATYLNVASSALTVNVANVAPVVDAGPDKSTTPGVAFSSSGSFTDPGTADTFTATVDYGDGTGPVALTLAANKTFSLGKAYASTGPYTVTVAVTDKDGGVNSDTATINVGQAAIPPVANPGGPYQTNEGTSVPLSGSGSTGTIDTYEWDFNYNGTTFNVSATGVSPTISGASLDGPSSRTIALRVTGGGTSNIATTTLTVANVAPTIAISGATTANEGATYTLTLGAVTDPGTDTVSSYVVHWGDGSTSTYATNGAKTHTYADGPTNNSITLDLTDEDNTYLNVASSALTVNVANIAPVVDAGPDKSITPGGTFSSSGSFTDPGADTWTATVDYGDGSGPIALALNGKTFSLSKIYPVANTYNVVVAITDKDGGVNSDTAVVTVSAATGPTKLTGTTIGTAGSYNNLGNTADKALDGSLSTFFDGPVANKDNAWVGLDLGTAAVVSEIHFAPRSSFAGRMTGGKFQGSNTADFSSGVVTLYTVPSAPVVGSLTVQTINNATAFRYVRYLGPSASYGDVAEVQFFTTGSVTPPTIPADPSQLGATAAAYNQINLSWTDNSNNETGFVIDRALDSNFTQSLVTFNAPTNVFQDTTVAANTTYYYRVRAVNSAGASNNSNTAFTTTPNAPAGPNLLTGTVIGTTGSYNNSGNTANKALDGNLTTFFDAPVANKDNAWVGLDLGTATIVTQIEYAPRVGKEARMIGGIFQASNTADFSSGVANLYTVTSTPPSGVLTVKTISNNTAYRYYRYLAPPNSYGDVAEVQFWG